MRTSNGGCNLEFRAQSLPALLRGSTEPRHARSSPAAAASACSETSRTSAAWRRELVLPIQGGEKMRPVRSNRFAPGLLGTRVSSAAPRRLDLRRHARPDAESERWPDSSSREDVVVLDGPPDVGGSVLDRWITQRRITNAQDAELDRHSADVHVHAVEVRICCPMRQG